MDPSIYTVGNKMDARTAQSPSVTASLKAQC
jgi:hypothetical protein